KILITGNTGIDSLLMTIKSDIPFKNKLLRKIEMEKIITVTTHRRESFGKPLIMILKAVAHLAGKFTDFKFILPVHPNPNVKENVQNKLKNIPNIILTKPLIYPDFVRLMSRSYLIISDSGGVQEEAPVLGKPVIVLREKTERPEAVKNHAAVLTGHDTNLIISIVSKLIDDKRFYRSMAKVRYLYGNGTAGEKIFKFIRKEI
ncbi:MAG: UDP-N-acetylglucosamine 2-epimerase, partial [bacterium]|nr:UDP-N-acetylglucosamine 2-epimerase [bacterium]